MRGRYTILYILLVACLLGPTLATATGAQASLQAVILHETDETGDTYAENLHRFGWALLDDGVPVVHRNALFQVLYNDVTLFATTPASGHDYDAMGRYWIGFPGAGEYEVNVEVPVDGGAASAAFNGTIDEREADPSRINWSPPPTATQDEPVRFEYDVLDAGNLSIDHAQVRFEVWNLERDTLVFQTDTHAHDAKEHAHELEYAFEEAGEHLLRLTAYHAHPKKRAEAVATTTATHTIQVAAGNGRLPAAPTAGPMENRVDEGESEGPYRIFTTYDPYTSVGVGNPIRLGALVTDESGTPVQHVDFSARIIGPDEETLFETGSLHSYDGVLEVTTSHQRTGDHRMIIEAESTRDGWTGTAESRYSVVAPAVTLTPGPHLVRVEGLDAATAGEPGEITVQVSSITNQPFAHGEIEFQIVQEETDRTLVAGKLHTHDDGLFPFTFTPPTRGDYRLHVDPYPLSPSPPTGFHGPDIGEARMFRFSADGPLDPFGLERSGEESGEDEVEVTPAPAALLAVLLAALCMILGPIRRDRRF